MPCGISAASQLYLGGMDLVAIQQALGHVWVATTMNYIHVHATHVEDATPVPPGAPIGAWPWRARS